MTSKEWYKVNKHKWREYNRRWSLKHVDHHRRIKVNTIRMARQRSKVHATQSGEPWGVVEDAMLFSGKPMLELIRELGRTMSAITNRKRRLRLIEEDNIDLKTGRRLR